jgi:hypothetical protein
MKAPYQNAGSATPRAALQNKFLPEQRQNQQHQVLTAIEKTSIHP